MGEDYIYYMKMGYGNIWVSQAKHLLSQQAGRDVGVPAAISHILTGLESDTMSPILKGVSREELLDSYFFSSPDFYAVRDEHGFNALEGELKRFHTGVYGGNPHDVSITLDILDEYVTTYGLGNEFRERAREKLGFSSLENVAA